MCIIFTLKEVSRWILLHFVLLFLMQLLDVPSKILKSTLYVCLSNYIYCTYCTQNKLPEELNH